MNDPGLEDPIVESGNDVLEHSPEEKEEAIDFTAAKKCVPAETG